MIKWHVTFFLNRYKICFDEWLIVISNVYMVVNQHVNARKPTYMCRYIIEARTLGKEIAYV
jgi:hypothetical protein